MPNKGVESSLPRRDGKEDALRVTYRRMKSGVELYFSRGASLWLEPLRSFGKLSYVVSCIVNE